MFHKQQKWNSDKSDKSETVLDATSFPDNHTKIRKKSHRKKKDIEDIINVFLELPPASVPVYVAKDISKLPPVNNNMDNFDLSGV